MSDVDKVSPRATQRRYNATPESLKKKHSGEVSYATITFNLPCYFRNRNAYLRSHIRSTSPHVNGGDECHSGNTAR